MIGLIDRLDGDVQIVNIALMGLRNPLLFTKFQQDVAVFPLF